MQGFFWTGNHLGWLFFLLLAVTLAGVVIFDFAWRMVTMPFKHFLAISGAAWLIVVIGIVLGYAG